MRRRAGAMLAAIALLAACGGQDGVSKSEFVAAGDAICTDANAQRESLQEPGLLSPPYEYERIARYSEALGATYADAIAELRKLEAPKEDGRAIAGILDDFEQAAGMSDEWVAASRAASTSGGTDAYFAWVQIASEAQQVAADYGFEACAQFGMP